MSTEIENMTGEVGKSFDCLPHMANQAFSNMIAGSIEGIQRNVGKLINAARGMVTSVIDKITGKEGLDEHSPSKVSEKIFDYFMEGGIKGMEKRRKDLVKEAAAAVTGTKAEFARLSSMRLSAPGGTASLSAAGAPGQAAAAAGGYAAVTVPVTIQNFYNNRDTDVQDLSNRIAAGVRLQIMSKGGKPR